jgi:hypothetical protein
MGRLALSLGLLFGVFGFERHAWALACGTFLQAGSNCCGVTAPACKSGLRGTGTFGIAIGACPGGEPGTLYQCIPTAPPPPPPPVGGAAVGGAAVGGAAVGGAAVGGAAVGGAAVGGAAVGGAGAGGAGVIVNLHAPVGLSSVDATKAAAATDARSAVRTEVEYKGTGFQAVGTGDPCSLSTKIDGKYSCAGTVQMGQTTSMVGMASMMMGSTVAQSAGMAAQNKVLNSGSSQKDALENSANAAETTAKTQGAIGIANAAMNLVLLKKGMDHTGFGTQIAAGGSEVSQQTGGNAGVSNYGVTNAQGRLNDQGNTVADKIVNKFDLNQNSIVRVTKVDTLTATNAELVAAQKKIREEEDAAHLSWGRSTAGRIAADSKAEQQIVSQQAKMQAMMGGMIAASQIASAASAMKSAKDMRAAAAKLGDTKSNAPFIKADPISGNIADGVQTAGNPEMITGNGDNPNAAPADSTQGPSGDNGNLGQGFNPNPLPSDLAPPLTPGKFEAGKPEGGGGGGPAAVGGGSTAAANAQPEDNQAKPVANQGSEKYESNGTFAAGGGGGKGAEGGPDLNSLMDKFLPKKEDADKKPDSILQFGAQGPGGPQSSTVYGRDADLFKNISKEMARKAQEGAIGVF